MRVHIVLFFAGTLIYCAGNDYTTIPAMTTGGPATISVDGAIVPGLGAVVPGTNNVGIPDATTTTMIAEGDIDRILKDECKVAFTDNPHRAGGIKYMLYEDVRGCDTASAAKALGASTWDLREWHKKGAIQANDKDAMETDSVKAKVSKLEPMRGIGIKSALKSPTREQPRIHFGSS